MARSRSRLSVLAAIAIGGLLLQAGGVTAATALPTRVYAPYFETWTTDSLTAISQQSGVKHFTLAFLETTSKTSCTLAWDGDKAQPVSGGRYLTEIGTLRAAGGDVIPSLGGWSADQGGTEIGDSCKDVNAIFVAYRDLVLKYDVSRIDMDIEGRSLTKTDGIDRRNQAIKLVQDWAASPAVNRPLTISYTLPTSASGLEASGLAVLQNAKTRGVRIDFVEPMVFDYYDRTTTNMGQAAVDAMNGLHAQLHTLLPSLTEPQLWAMQGATIMNGIDDYPRRTEVTQLADAQLLRDFAVSHGMSALSMWAIQRDNGNCPGNGGANDCSGITQATWAFSDILRTFTSP
jgi:hypothetical protein